MKTAVEYTNELICQANQLREKRGLDPVSEDVKNALLRTSRVSDRHRTNSLIKIQDLIDYLQKYKTYLENDRIIQTSVLSAVEKAADLTVEMVRLEDTERELKVRLSETIGEDLHIKTH